MNTKISRKELDELYEALVKIETKEEAKLFLDDLLSKNELKSLCGRIHSAKLFLEGKTYVEVIEETEISSATLARVSKCVKTGKGYNKILTKE
ncbi:MAG: TrpR-related protein YerC/YecD [Bacilli bacterium]|nr:TrpR-related protein YerC/YecD [Bacilli bacterium]